MHTSLLKKASLCLIVVFLLIIQYYSIRQVNHPRISISKQDNSFNFDPDVLDLFSLGNQNAVASLLWISTLVESDLEHYKKKDKNSWMYHRFNTITELNPNFLEAYTYGGLYLSIIKDDDIGAKHIYDKGIEKFPDDWNLNFYSGYHYYLELKDFEGAAKRYERIINHPKTPLALKIILAKIKGSSNNLKESFTIIFNFYRGLPKDHLMKNKLYNYLYAIKAEIDLNCLNSKTKEKCQTRDFEGNKYIKKNNEYKAVKSWESFRIKRQE